MSYRDKAGRLRHYVRRPARAVMAALKEGRKWLLTLACGHVARRTKRLPFVKCAECQREQRAAQDRLSHDERLSALDFASKMASP